MANADVTVSSSRTTSEATDLSKESREVEFETAGKTPPRKRSKTGDHSATRARDEDWEPATPVKRSARNRTPKAGWGESAKKKKREQPVFDPEKHSWNKMKVRPIFSLYHILAHQFQMSSAHIVLNVSEPRNDPASPSNQVQRDALDAYLTMQGATLVIAKRLAVWRLPIRRKLPRKQERRLL